MKKIALALAFILLISTALHSACPQVVRQVYVPAVVGGQEGGLLKASVRIEPGNGTIYTEIIPVVGASTQLSQAKAVEQAFASSNFALGDCNVYFSFLDMGQSPSVDGPSAGLAMAVALKSALEGTQIRDDVAITGAILGGGQVGPVGGIIDKAQAASRHGRTILISPKQAIYESILLSKLAQEYEFVALEASTLQEAYEIAVSDKSKKYSPNFKLQQSQIPANLPSRELSQEDIRFTRVANSINDNLFARADFEPGGELEKYAKHFRDEAEQNRKISKIGYGYTAANNAFLAQIDAAFLSTPAHKIDLEKEIELAKNCVQSIPEVLPTYSNFDWVAGANARRNWANSKIEEVENASSKYDSSEEKYLALREILYARSWCLASQEIAKIATELGGEQISNEVLEVYARLKVAEAQTLSENALIKNPDAAWHMKIANISMENGDYAGAIFDAAYVLGSQGATNSESEFSEEEIELEVRDLALENYTSLWGRTYQSQGIYSIASYMEKEQPLAGAYGILKLSKSMEETLLPIREMGSREETSEKETLTFIVEKPSDGEASVMAVGILLTFGILLLVVLHFITNRKARKK